jgi:hypothetical protein
LSRVDFADSCASDQLAHVVVANAAAGDDCDAIARLRE